MVSKASVLKKKSICIITLTLQILEQRHFSELFHTFLILFGQAKINSNLKFK